ncbi:MAG: UpxY family transcription antiterminator [Candidatus Acidiferrum sp.]
MGQTHIANVNSRALVSCVRPVAQPCWYALHTCANHEKMVARQLELRSFECFLPLFEKMSRWKDRQVRVQLPLFSGYVLVRMALTEKLRALQIPGVVRLVGFGGQAAPIDDHEMQALQRGFDGGLLAEPCPYLTIGRRVRVRSGPLQGLEGILSRKKTICRFVLSLHLIQRSMAVEVNAEDLEAIG